jgi:hypothetical protein
VDMATPLHHTWTYQALAHDVLDLALNRVVVEENAGRSPSGGTKVKTRACDLDTGDKFWMSHKGRSVSGGYCIICLEITLEEIKIGYCVCVDRIIKYPLTF